MGRRILVLAIAVALAVISGYAVWQYLISVEVDIKADVQEVEVFRATAPIASGTPGEEARSSIETSVALRNQVVFEGSTILCTGAVGSNADQDPNLFGCLQNPNDLNLVLEGNVAAGPIAAGQLITVGSFADTRDLQQRLSDAIAPGRVTIAISVDVTAASGGFIRPGDNVNILASASLTPLSFLEVISKDDLRALLVQAGATPEGEPPGEGVGEGAEEFGPANLAGAIPTSFDVTQTILQNIQVLAVGIDTRPAPLDIGLDPGGLDPAGLLEPVGGVIVFEVTPREAELIEYARQHTSIALSLLPTGEYVPYDSRPIVVDDIFGLLERIETELEQVGEGDGR